MRQIVDPSHIVAGPTDDLPLLRLGFRPFYLLGSLFGMLAIPAWLAQYDGHWRGSGYLPGMLWHAHEMVFGFACAVIVGFLLTAVRAWTEQPTPTGHPLAAIVLLWLAGRIGLLTLPGGVAAAIDVALLPVVAIVLGRCLLRANNRRNLFIPVLLMGLAILNLLFHLAAMGRIHANPLSFIHAAIYLITLLEIIIAGRIVPRFTANAVPGVKQFTSHKLELGVMAGSLLGLALAASSATGLAVSCLYALLAIAHLVRLLGWGAAATVRKPILWALHLGYAWIPLGFAGLAASALGHLNPIAVTHAFAVGAMGGLIVAMVTRTALGHTGRPLLAGRQETYAYLAVALAATCRIVPLLWPGAGHYTLWLCAAGLLWVAAFASYFLKYRPYLCRPRLDGKPG